MANSININGTEYRIEGDDLATEATLRSLVAAMNRLARAGGPGGAGGGGAAGAGAALNQGLDEVAGNLDDMGGSVIRMNANNNEIIRLQGGTAKGFNILGGATKLLTGAFKVAQGAFMIGVGIVSAAFGAVDEMADTVKGMNAAGIRFQGGFAELAAAAGSAGLSVEELGRIMTDNHAAVARFGGGNMNEGAKKLTAFSRELAFGKSNLAGLGIGVSEAAQYLADYADIQQNLTHQDITRARAGETAADVQKRVTASTADYVSDLDSLARSTGKTRDEMNKLMSDLSKNVDITSTLDMLGLAGKQKDSVMKFAALLSGLPGGDTLMSGLKDLLQFGTMTGDTAAAFATVGPQLQSTFTGIADKLKSGAITEEEARDQMMNAMGDNAEQISKTLGAIPESQRTQAQKDILLAANAAKANKAAREGEIKDFFDANKAKYKTMAAAEEAFNKQRSAELTAQTELNDVKKRFGGVLKSLLLKVFGSEVFMSIFKKIVTGLEKFADFMYSALKKVDPYIKKFDAFMGPIITKAMTFIKTAFDKVKEILGKVDLGKLFENIYTVFSVVRRAVMDLIANIDLGAIFQTVSDLFMELAGFVNQVFAAIDFKMIGDLFMTVFGTVSDVIKDLWARVKGVFASQDGGMAGTLGKIVNGLGKFIKAAARVFKLLYDYVLSPILDILGPIIGTIVNLLVSVFDVFANLADFFGTLIDFFTGDASFSELFDKVIAVFGSVFSGVWTLIKDLAKVVASPFVAIYNFSTKLNDAILGAVKKVLDTFDFGAILTKVIDSIKNVFASITKWWKDFSFMDMLNSVLEAITGLFSGIVKYIKDKLNPFNWFKKDKGDAAKKPPPPATSPQDISKIPEGQRTPAQKEILAKAQAAAAPATPTAASVPAAATALAKPAAGTGKVVNTDDLIKKISAQIDMMTQVLMAIEKQGEEKPGMVSSAFSSLTKNAFKTA